MLDDDEYNFGLETDGPSSSLLSTAGLTSTSLESMIPVNTLIMSRVGYTGLRPLTAQVSAERGEDMIDSLYKPCRRAAVQQGKTTRRRELEMKGKRESALHSLAN